MRPSSLPRTSSLAQPRRPTPVSANPLNRLLSIDVLSQTLALQLSPSPDQATSDAVRGDAPIIEELINTSSLASPARELISQLYQEAPRNVEVEALVSNEEVK